MGLADIREQIKTILSGVSGIGVVHDYERWSADWKKFLDLFRAEDDDGTKRINGWMFARKSTAEKLITAAEYQRVYTFRIQGLYGLKDAEETGKTFQSLIEAVCDAFRENYNLNNTCETTSPDFGQLAGRSGMQVETIEQQMFGGVLCHYCDLLLGVQTIEEV